MITEQIEMEFRPPCGETEARLRARLVAVRKLIEEDVDSSHAIYVLLEEMIDAMFIPTVIVNPDFVKPEEL
jgi:hypothetical protein